MHYQIKLFFHFVKRTDIFFIFNAFFIHTPLFIPPPKIAPSPDIQKKYQVKKRHRLPRLNSLREVDMRAHLRGNDTCRMSRLAVN
jgi:hypothetical protein